MGFQSTFIFFTVFFFSSLFNRTFLALVPPVFCFCPRPIYFSVTFTLVVFVLGLTRPGLFSFHDKYVQRERRARRVEERMKRKEKKQTNWGRTGLGGRKSEQCGHEV